MVDLIIVLVLAAIVGAAVIYIVKAKKSGVKCIGCPAAGECSHSNASGCGCGCSNETDGEGCCGCHTDTKE